MLSTQEDTALRAFLGFSVFLVLAEISLGYGHDYNDRPRRVGDHRSTRMIDTWGKRLGDPQTVLCR